MSTEQLRGLDNDWLPRNELHKSSAWCEGPAGRATDRSVCDCKANQTTSLYTLHSRRHWEAFHADPTRRRLQVVVNFNRLSTSDDVEIAACEQFSQLGPVAWQLNFQYHQAIQTIFIIIIISLFIQQQNSTNTVTNVDTNEVETGMTRLIALTVTPVY